MYLNFFIVGKCVCGGKKNKGVDLFNLEYKARLVKGYEQAKLVKGYEPSHRPWMAFIQMKKDKSKYKCGGSIINSYWILSAGHCFCEQLECKPSQPSNSNNGGKLKIAFKPEDHIRIITGIIDFDLINSKSEVSVPNKIFIHPL